MSDARAGMACASPVWYRTLTTTVTALRGARARGQRRDTVSLLITPSNASGAVTNAAYLTGAVNFSCRATQGKSGKEKSS